VNRQPLFRKYVAVFVILVSGALITSGLVQMYFSYQENPAALLSIRREKAAGAATRIEQFLQEIERQISGSIQVGPAGSPVSTDQRRGDYLRLLREAPAITEISYLDPRRETSSTARSATWRAKPKLADLPVEQPIVWDLVVNVSTRKALGLTIPPSVLPLVTEWIQ